MEPLEPDGAIRATEPGPCNVARLLGDPSPCEGAPDVVLLLDSAHTPTDREMTLRGILACVHHGAQLYALMTYARVYPASQLHGGQAIEVYRRAMKIADERAAAHVAGARNYLGGKAA